MLKLKDVKLKENEHLFIGYFKNNGKEYANLNKIQMASGWFFEHLQEHHQEMEVYKIDKGYATKIAMKYMGLSYE